MPRLFVALRPPEPVRDALIDTMEALDGARWQDDEQLHLTLRFCGEVDRRTAEDLATALDRIAFAPFEIQLSGVGHFERKGRPHAIWAKALPTPPLLELHKAVERACHSAGLPPEARAFHPHVTIARLNRGTAPIGAWLARHNTLHAGWRATGFKLYQSHLSRSGSHYEPLARYRADPRAEDPIAPPPVGTAEPPHPTWPTDDEDIA